MSKIELQYPEHEIEAIIKEQNIALYRCPDCNSILLDGKTEKLLLQQKKVLRSSIIPDGKLLCPNYLCAHSYGQYIDKFSLENQISINNLKAKIKKLEERIEYL